MAKKIENLTIEELTDKLVVEMTQAKQLRRKAEQLLNHAANMEIGVERCKARIAELAAQSKPEPTAEAIAQTEALRKFHA